MKYPNWLTQIFYWVSDAITAAIPRKKPTKMQLQQIKVMAHRGLYDNTTIKENTIAAFQQALNANVWAIEMDLRWTKDLQPVVHHDVDTQRVFGEYVKINEVTLAELKQRFPDIPTLDEVAKKFGKKIKLIIEFKAEHYKQSEQRKTNLQSALAGLTPITDFYFISLEPALLEIMNCYPSQSYFPIGAIDMQSMSELALQKNYAGVMGHYVFTKQSIIMQQHHHRKLVCTGFIDSKNCLLREINRNVDIISTNQALKMQQIIDQYKE